MQKESYSGINRRRFLKLALSAPFYFLIPGCGQRNGEEIVRTEDKPELSGFKVVNNWIYPVGFNTDRFFDIISDFGLPITFNKSIEIVLTNDTIVYETPHERQSHTVTISQDDNPDRIEISCGQYVETVKRETGREPQTFQDELFLSTILSESIFNGFADLAAARGEMTIDEANRLADLYSEELHGRPLSDTTLIFTRVFLNQQKPGDYQV